MSNNSKLVSALLIGAAAGAVLGLLFAPDKGSETRKKIRKEGEDLLDELSDKIEEGKDALMGLKEKAMSKAQEWKGKAEDLKDEAEAELNHVKGKAKQAASNY